MLRAALFVALTLAAPAFADGFRTFSGHGGPIMDIAVAPDGRRILTASFDNSLGLWEVEGTASPVWLEGHGAAVNAAAFLPKSRAVSVGDDFEGIIWDLETHEPAARLDGHTGKIVSVRPSPDASRIATASWDGTIRLWDGVSGHPTAVLTGHEGPINDVAWARGGATLYSAGYDGLILEHDVAAGASPRRVVSHGFGVNVLAIDEAAGWLAFGAADGGVEILDPATGATIADLSGDRRPILALARSPDGTRLAIGDGDGYIMIVATADWHVERDFHAALNGPIWALAFTAVSQGIIAGGIADEAMLWPLSGGPGEGDERKHLAESQRRFHVAPGTVSNGERQFLRKCSICHSLEDDGARHAGPSLHAVFGRRAGSLPGYGYTAALRQSGIIWSETTIDRLFALGPEHVTPGSKMPMQRIVAAQDRADLIAFLKRETAPE
ncbi:MAG: c-type cytochrome [Rhodobacteraceae bacterium]|nr:c-type cytochrome [Paracoccaceae bacterium]